MQKPLLSLDVCCLAVPWLLSGTCGLLTADLAVMARRLDTACLWSGMFVIL